MARQRRRKWSDEDLVQLARSGKSVASFLRSIEVDPTTYNYQLVREDLKRLGLEHLMPKRKKRPRRIVWTKEQIEAAVAGSVSISEVILRLTGDKKQNSGQWR